MEIINQLVNKVKKGQWGFRMKEVMTGEHEFEPGQGPEGKQPFKFDVTWGTEDLGSWIKPSSRHFMVNDLRGRVTVGGLCKNLPCQGRLELKYFTENKIKYIFDFKYKNKDYHFVGEKVNIHLWNLPVAHTTCFGVLTEKKTGKLISRSLTHFHFKTVPSFLASFRIV